MMSEYSVFSYSYSWNYFSYSSTQYDYNYHVYDNVHFVYDCDDIQIIMMIVLIIKIMNLVIDAIAPTTPFLKRVRKNSWFLSGPVPFWYNAH